MKMHKENQKVWSDTALSEVPSGQVLMSTLDASFLAWPADVVLTTSTLKPASCHNLQLKDEYGYNRNSERSERDN